MASRKPADSSSIAGQIASQWQLERLSWYLSSDLLVIIASVISWCVAAESTYYSPLTFDISRSLNFDPNAGDFWQILETGVYTFGEYSLSCGLFTKGLTMAVCGMGILQAVTWLISCLSSYFRAKKILAPLNTIAVNTGYLTEAANRTNYSFDDIESAIGKMDVSSDIHISTGNRDLRRLEEAINGLLDRMRESYKSQSRFVSDASHELRTPIAVIKGYADMLDRWGKSDEKILEEGITAIKSESENMNRLVEQLLFLARGDNGRQQITVTEFSLSELIGEVKNEAEMIDPDHKYFADIKEEVSVRGDFSMLKQTARILCDNAKKYTPKGNSITVRVFTNEKKERCFEVQDTGIGIAEQDIPRIFDRFFRSDPARNRETGGTGLGLSIAKWIVDRHNGHFEVISYKDIGTRITVCLPESSGTADSAANE